MDYKKRKKQTVTIFEINRRYEIRAKLIKKHGWASRAPIEKVANSVNAEMPTPSQTSKEEVCRDYIRPTKVMT